MIRRVAKAGDGDTIREQVYGGAIFLFDATAAARTLADAVMQLVDQAFAGMGDPRQAQFHIPNEEFLERLSPVRARLATDVRFLTLCADVLQSLGMTPSGYAADVPRLRAIQHDGHLIAQAAPAYSAHRDTWFANPLSQLNWWIPLHDVTEDETFGFYEECWGKPIPNDSQRFDLAAWKARASWHRPGGVLRTVYPTVVGSPPLGLGVCTPMAAHRGDILLFSAAHLHEPARNRSGRTRFSVDFRTVHLADHQQGCGAPRTDEHCVGSTFGDYVRLSGSA